MKTFYLFLFFFFSLFQISIAQNVEDLKRETHSLKDTLLIDNYFDIAKIYYSQLSNMDSALYYSELAYQKSNDIQNTNKIIKGLIYLATIKSTFNDIKINEQAIIHLKEALEIAQSIKDKNSIADIYVKLGSIYFNKGSQVESMKNYVEATRLLEELGNYDKLVEAYIGISGLYISQQQTEKRLFYARKSLSILDKVKSPFIKVSGYIHISQHYIELHKKDSLFLDTALVLSKKGLEIAEENNLLGRIPSFYHNFSSIYGLKNDSKNSKKYALKTLEYKKHITSHLKYLIYIQLFKEELKIKNFNEAQHYLDSAKIYVPKQDEYQHLNILQQEYLFHKQKGNYKQALEIYEHFKELKDKVQNKEKNKQINEIEEKYNKAKNEKTIKELAQEKDILTLRNQFLAIGLGFIVLILILLFIYYRQSVLKQKYKIVETELRLNRARMNPHLFFNILSALQSYALKYNDARNVSLYLSKYAKVMRSTLENTFVEFVTLEEEADFLTNYLQIQQFISSNKFNFEIEIDEDLESDELFIPTMLIQPFVENSIEHGFALLQAQNENENTQKGELLISFIKKENEVEIKITDNGIGLSKENEKIDFVASTEIDKKFTTEKIHTSRATQIVKDRLYLLEEVHKLKTYFSIQNKEGERGVSVIFRLPLTYNLVSITN